MTSIGIVQILTFFVAIALATKPMGAFMAAVLEGRRTWLHPALRPLERAIYRLSGIGGASEQRWTQYAGALLAFSFASFLVLYLMQRAQGLLPSNPQGFSSDKVSPDLAFNTAISFMANTNWQAYSGENTLSYFVQMAGLTVQNFVSAAAGIAVAIAVIRGFARQQIHSIGNFWVDLTRATLYILLPISLLAAIFLCSQGLIQNWRPYVQAETIEGSPQRIPQGLVASQEAIKELGTNGGGFFNANSAHPYENPTPLTNFVETFLIFLIPAGLTYTFGKMVGDSRQGWAIFAAMSALFLAGAFAAYASEQAGNPILTRLGIEQTASDLHSGGNMEGKEVRFGIASSALFATVTTGASCGAVISMHDSYTPLGGLVPMFNMLTNEVIFGGVGAGLYGMLLFAILAVFIAGLIVGRTPEYIGKKIEGREVKMCMLALITTAASVLLFTSASTVLDFDRGSYLNPPGATTENRNNEGPHGFSEILYAYGSGTGNNGSAFGGLNANTPWYNLTIGFAILIGRFLMIVPLLAVAGSLAVKRTVPTSAGTFPTDGPLFVVLLTGTVLIVGALTFFPALSLGPIVEHFLMHELRVF
jgi:K+-transporting ATPase ATPase A chain